MKQLEIIDIARTLGVHHWESDGKGSGDFSPKIDEHWKGKDHGVIFDLSKHQGAVPFWQKDNDYLLLKLKGKRKGKEKLEKAFIGALGKPDEKKITGPNATYVLLWDGRTPIKNASKV
jgi:hypothetical protein